MRFYLVSIACIFILSCQSKMPNREIASEVKTSKSVEDKTWAEQYFVAQKSCKIFKSFRDQKAPSPDLEIVVKTKYKMKCASGENLLANLEQSWLKKDIILNGLRTTRNAQAFAAYYREFLNLSFQDRNKIEFLERTKLFQKILKNVTNVKIRNELLWMFPAFYGDYKIPIPKEKRFEAAYEYRMQRRFSEARKIYNEIIQENKKTISEAKKTFETVRALENISRASDFVRNTYRIEEKKQLGIKNYKKDYLFFKNFFFKKPKAQYAKYYTDAVVQLARDLWTEGQLEEAKKILQDTVAKASGKAPLDQVYWVQGRIRQEAKDYKGAIELFQKALGEKPEKSFELKLLWLIAWNFNKNAQYKESLDGLREFSEKADQYQDKFGYYKGLFWQGLMSQKLHKKDSAKDFLQKVAKEFPMSYYGRLALLKTDTDELTKNTQLKNFPQDSDIIDANSRTTIQNLIAIREFDLVSEYLINLWRKLEKDNRKQIENRIAFLAWSYHAQLYKENLQFIEILSDDDKKEILKKYPQLLFPEPYLDITSQYETKFNMPREFVYSLMRQESLFDKNARSQADAFGLLQLLPKNAKKYMKEAGVYFTKPEELYKPDVIIPLGMAHLKHLREIFRGSLLLAAASYNAGVNPVKGWLISRYQDDVLEFIEDIPYLETEYYAKLIFRNLSYYLQFHPELTKEQKIQLLESYFIIDPQLTPNKSKS